MKKKIALIPIDNRPVCYDLLLQTSEIDHNIELLLPPIHLLGDLNKIADINQILSWLDNLKDVHSIIVSLDTIAYGGLIPSRRSSDSFETVKSRIDSFFSIINKKNICVYAFSSIMRISDNNINDEEKEYWKDYGKLIFDFSYNYSKSFKSFDYDNFSSYSCIKSKIPQDILQDYINTRNRNFLINIYYINLAKNNNLIKKLIFSKDDCAQYGLNILEAEELCFRITQSNINAIVKTGADEIPFSLLSLAYLNLKNTKLSNNGLKIATIFSFPESISKVSNYEDVSVFESIKSQIEIIGSEYISDDIYNADLILVINNFKSSQGEIVIGIENESSLFKIPRTVFNKPFFIVDILNANGADFNFVLHNLDVFSHKNFYGFSAWNTTSNALGSAISCAVFKLLANLSSSYNDLAFKKLQTIRLLDDWAFQSNVRQKIRSLYPIFNNDLDLLKQKMNPFESIILESLDTCFNNISYSYPWNRYFELRCYIL